MFNIFSGDIPATLFLILVVFNLKHIINFLTMMKFRMRCSDWQTAERDQIPSATLHLLVCAEQELEKLGFERVCSLSLAPFNFYDPRELKFSELYWHPEKAVLAMTGLAEVYTGQVTKVDFLSLFTDGNALETVNRELWAQLPTPKQIQVVDAYADDLPGQWQFHLQALDAELIKQRAVITDKDEAVQLSKSFGLSCWIARMQELGWVKTEPSGLYSLKAWAAWQYVRQLNRLPKEAANALSRPYHHDPIPDILPARLAEMNSIAASTVLAAQPYPFWIKLVLFVLTLLLSVVLFGMNLEFVDVAAILVVLFIHEMGHLTAMWAFNYRNLSILFLPLLGAVATGHKAHATASQESIVLLAGPLLGLLSVLAATQIPADVLPMQMAAFVRAYVEFGLIINLFNLLPVGMLDGGRLFKLAVLGRFPYARAVFAALGVLVGLGYALWSHSLIFGVAMLMLLIGIPADFKTARIIKAIHAKAKAEKLKKLDQDKVMEALAGEFVDSHYGDNDVKSRAKRKDIATLAYPRLLQGVPSLLVSLGALSAQLFSLIVPLLLVVWFLQQPEPIPALRVNAAEMMEINSKAKAEPLPEESPKDKAAREKFQASLNAEQDLSKKWDMLAAEMEKVEEEFDYAPAWLMEQREALFAQLPANHPEKLRDSLYRIDITSDGAAEAIIAIINQATANGTHKAADLDKAHFAVLIDAYEILSKTNKPVELLRSQFFALSDLWIDLEPTNSAYATYRPQLALILARISTTVGENKFAAIWMEYYFVNARPDEKQAALIYGWFQLDNGHADKALDMAKQAIQAATPEESYFITEWRALAGWAEMARGHAREADGYFQAVLDARVKRVKEMDSGLPWWVKVLTFGRGNDFTKPGLDFQTFDHLAALQTYNPEQASQLMAELGKLSKEKKQRAASVNFFGVGKWGGKARKAAHESLLKSLGLV